MQTINVTVVSYNYNFTGTFQPNKTYIINNSQSSTHPIFFTTTPSRSENIIPFVRTGSNVIRIPNISTLHAHCTKHGYMNTPNLLTGSADNTYDKELVVTVVSSSGNKYRFDGTSYEFVHGEKVLINQIDPTNLTHPIYFRNTNNWTSSNYNSGDNLDNYFLGVPGFSTIFTVPTTISSIHAHCANHSNMGSELSLTVTDVCFHEETPIETQNGTFPIKNLERGMMIKTLNGYRPLAKLMKNEYVHHGQQFVLFPAHCFGANKPMIDVRCTKPHPLKFGEHIVPSVDFVNKVKGVKLVYSPSNQYNIVFDTHEVLNIQGLDFISHHPRHLAAPLKKDEYIDVKNYNDCKYFEKVSLFDDIKHLIS